MSSSYSDPGQHLFWLSSRALGMVALVLLALSVTLGLALSSKLFHRPGLPAWLKRLHEAIALCALGAIAGHGLLLLGDRYLHPGLAGIALPFALAGQPAWTGIGIIGGWLAAIVGLSFYARRLIGVRAWRWLHRWTLAAYALSVAHVLGSGTDAASAWFVLSVGALSAPPVFLLLTRLLPRSRPAGTPSAVRS